MWISNYLNPLALDEWLGVREDSEHHVLYGTLLLEDHPCQVEQHLVPLHLQLTLLVQLSIPQPNPTELQIAGEYFLIHGREGWITLLVYHLQHKNHLLSHVYLIQGVLMEGIQK